MLQFVLCGFLSSVNNYFNGTAHVIAEALKNDNGVWGKDYTLQLRLNNLHDTEPIRMK
jgi:hypothetical protein